MKASVLNEYQLVCLHKDTYALRRNSYICSCVRVVSRFTDDDLADCSSPVTLRSDALSQFDSVDDALEVCHVKQRLAVHKAWRATIRTTRSQHGVAHSSNAESTPCLENLVRNLYMSSSLERALDTKHCKPDNAFALVYIAQLDVLHVVESHGWGVLGQKYCKGAYSPRSP